MRWQPVQGPGDMRRGISMIDVPMMLGAGRSEFDFMLQDAMDRMHMAAYRTANAQSQRARRFPGPRDAPGMMARTMHQPAWMDPNQLTRNPGPPRSIMNNVWVGQAGTYPGRR